MRGLALTLSAILLLSGCSKLMPYNEKFACERGSKVVICKKVSEIYEMDENKLKSLQEDRSCNCDHKKDEQKNNRGTIILNNIKKEPKIKKDDDAEELKEIIKDTSISSLKQPIKLEIEIDHSDKTDQKSISEENKNQKQTKIINGYVRVCVYRANIRVAPSCKAKIARVAKRGEKLYALYEKDGWIKLEDGNYIHKSIVRK